MIVKSRIVNNPLKGTVVLDGDKSISHRAVMVSSISKGKSIISNILESEDVSRTINTFLKLGVRIKKKNNKLVVYGKGLYSLKKPNKIIYLGNSGTSARLLTGILAAQPFNTTITGDKSLCSRPMGRIIKPLLQMNARLKSKNNKLPLFIQGGQKLKPIKYKVPLPSAQIKSGLLLASLYINGKTQIIEKSITRNHTEIMLKSYGANIKIKNKIINLKGGKELKASKINIPCDFSSASFFIVAALIVKGSFIKIKNINLNSTRIGLLKALHLMGGKIKIKNKKKICGETVGDIEVKYSKLKGCNLKSNISPTMIDEYPIIAIAASQASSPSKFNGLKELKHKESNRLNSISLNLKRCGIKNIIKNNNLTIYPSKNNQNKVIKIDPKKDHRIAMSFAVMGMVYKHGIKIKDAEYINTSFPNFIEKINNIGANIFR